jgi:molybdate transport system permease protein
LAQTAVALPFAIKVLYTAFEGVDRRYEWVARSLGYKPWEVFFKVVLPMVRGGLFSALAVAFARAFGAFGAVLIFAGGVRMKTETLPVGVFLSLSYGEMDKAVVMGSLLMVASLVTLLIIELLGEGKKQPRR